MAEPQRFRSAVFAVALAFHTQGRMVPGVIVRLGRLAGERVIRHLDSRRERREL